MALTEIFAAISRRFLEICLLVFGVISLFGLCYRLPSRFSRVADEDNDVLMDADPVDNRVAWRASLAISVIHGLLCIYWCSAVFFCRFVARRRRRTAASWERPDRRKVLMTSLYSPTELVERYGGRLLRAVDNSMVIIGYAGPARLRDCEHCGLLRDRMRHCDEIGKCLPMFNHFCGALWIPVYLETFKPYMCFLFAFVLDGLLVIGSLLWAMIDYRTRGLGFEMIVLLLAVILFGYAGMMLHLVGQNVGLRNRTRDDINRGGFVGVLMAATEETRSHGLVMRLRWIASNPWDLGAWENWCAMMGRPATWLL